MRSVRPSVPCLAALALAAFVAEAAADCTCRALGRSFELGERACLPTPNGPRIATCGVVLNNTNWEMSETPCPSAGAAPHVRAARQAPAAPPPAFAAYPRPN